MELKRRFLLTLLICFVAGESEIMWTKFFERLDRLRDRIKNSTTLPERPPDANDYLCSQREDGIAMCRYETHMELGDRLRRLQDKFPALVQVKSIGQSALGADLLSLRIGANVTERRLLGVPIFRYIANLHGDEALGRQLLVYLAEYLATRYGSSKRVTRLLDNTEVHLLPTGNPDGFSVSLEGCDVPVGWFRFGKSGRNNANGRDLDRDYPSWFQESEKRLLHRERVFQPETEAIMEWTEQEQAVISAGLHSGEVVALYPYHDAPDMGWSMKSLEAGGLPGRYAATPDDAFFRQAAELYAKRHTFMHKGTNCEGVFDKGVANGAEARGATGTIADFLYANTNTLHLSLELSCCPRPPSSQLRHEWLVNREALLSLMEVTHLGLKGMVLSDRYLPVAGARVVVLGIERDVVTTLRGEYWRPLVPGVHTVYAVADGFRPSFPQLVKVEKGLPVPKVRHFMLRRMQEGEKESLGRSSENIEEDQTEP